MAKIFLWCDEYSKILDTLSGIKEYDIMFKNKISILENNFDNKKKVEGEKVKQDEKLLEDYMIGIKEFKYNEELWLNRLEEVKLYIDNNGKRPSKHDKNKQVKQLSYWLSDRLKNKYNITYNIKFNNLWIEFINDEKYKECLISIKEKWFNNFKDVKKYFIENNKKPYQHDKNKNIKKMGKWVMVNKINYINNNGMMKYNDIKKLWKEFINEFHIDFLSNEEKWFSNLKKVEEYIIQNNKRPSGSDKNKDIKFLAKWIGHQQINYTDNEQIMKDKNIRETWEKFIYKYKILFESNENIWYDNLQKVIDYIDKNNKRPSSTDNDNNIKCLGAWVCSQFTNYQNNDRIMKNETIKKSWEEFINKYTIYFLSNEEEFNNNLKQVKEYIIQNNKRPSSKDTKTDIKKLGAFIQNQQIKYKNKQGIMKNEEIYNLWTKFINDPLYRNYF